MWSVVANDKITLLNFTLRLKDLGLIRVLIKNFLKFVLYIASNPVI